MQILQEQELVGLNFNTIVTNVPIICFVSRIVLVEQLLPVIILI